MGCDRFINRSGECGQVMGTFGVQRIALRGPGCIDGTGRCVAGTGGRRRCCDDVAGAGDFRCDNILGTGGRRRDHHDDVMGTGGRRCRDEVAGEGGRDKRWDICEWCLKTPITVPR